MRILWIGLALSLTGGIAPKCARAADLAGFEGMPDKVRAFLSDVFSWKVPEDRPRLIISKGVVLAWLTDPATFLPTPNPRSFYENGNRPLVIVPAGKAIIAFPPRTSNAASVKLGQRLTDKQYQLAVTEDGKWGVIDLNRTTRFFDEPVLWKYSTEEAQFVVPVNPDQDVPTFGMWNGLALPFDATASHDQSVGLTSGDTFRILQFEGDQAVVDFKSSLRDIQSKRGDIEGAAKKIGAQPADTFRIPSSGVVQFQINDTLVPHDKLDDWRHGNANYLDIFRHAFSNVRIPSGTTMTAGCGVTTNFTTNDSRELGLSATGEQSLGGTWFGLLTAKVSFSESATKQIKSTSGTSFTAKSFLRRRLYPVEFHSPDGKDEFFWAGTATTCSKAKQNWTTIMVRQGDTEYFLDKEFYPWATATEVEPAALDLPSNDPLGAVMPGGDPLDRQRGVFVVKCAPQENALEAAATTAMHDSPPYAVLIAIALASGVQPASVQNLSQYYSAKGCPIAPSRQAAALTQ
jgi:hypothetical protein